MLNAAVTQQKHGLVEEHKVKIVVLKWQNNCVSLDERSVKQEQLHPNQEKHMPLLFIRSGPPR